MFFFEYLMKSLQKTVRKASSSAFLCLFILPLTAGVSYAGGISPYSDRQLAAVASAAYNTVNIKDENNSLSAMTEMDAPDQWKIINVFDDQGAVGTGIYAFTIATDDSNCIIAFRGTHVEDEGDNALTITGNVMQDVVLADLGLANSGETSQQHAAERYVTYIYNEIGDKYGHFTFVGHSLGGNLAEHALITAPDELKEKADALSLDGPGFSSIYIDERKEAIRKVNGKLRRRSWTAIGIMLNTLPGEDYGYADVPTGKHNDFNSIQYDDDGNIKPGKTDIGEQISHYFLSYADKLVRGFSTLFPVTKDKPASVKETAVRLGKDPSTSSIWLERINRENAENRGRVFSDKVNTGRQGKLNHSDPGNAALSSQEQEEYKSYSRADYIKIYRTAFCDIKQRHDQETAEKRGNDSDLYDNDIPYNAVSYTLCDITGDGIRELIAEQIIAKHGAAVWIYSLKDGVPYFMGETGGDTGDYIAAGYAPGYIFENGYKGAYSLEYREWNGTEFVDHPLYEGSWDYWERGTGPSEPPSFEELSDYYDKSRISDYPAPWCEISDFRFYTEEHDAEMFDGEGTAALYKPILDMYLEHIRNNWTSLDGNGTEDLFDPDSVSYMWERMIETYSTAGAGYLLRDLNHDGTPELIMATTNGAADGTILDLYTISNGQVLHLASNGGTHYTYYLGKDDAVMNYGFAGSVVKGYSGYRIIDGQLSEEVKLLFNEGEYFYKAAGTEEEVPISEQEFNIISDELKPAESFIVVPFSEYEIMLENDDTAETEMAVPTEEITADNHNQIRTSTEGEELYKSILDLYYSNILNNWDGFEDASLEEPVSFLWWHYDKDLGLQKAGYAFVDLDQNGVPELLTSNLDHTYNSGSFYDLYSCRSGEIIHLASSGDRYFYSVTSEGKIYEDASGGALHHYDYLYHISGDGDKLQLEQVVYYEKDNNNNEAYYSGPDLDHLQRISQSDAALLQGKMKTGKEIHFKPFSQYK